MAKPKPPAETVTTWLKENLGPQCLAPLTSTDRAALQAAVQIVGVYAHTRDNDTANAFALIVGCMQGTTWHLAYHSIAHVMDWNHREELWGAAGLPKLTVGRCKFEPPTGEAMKFAMEQSRLANTKTEQGG